MGLWGALFSNKPRLMLHLFSVAFLALLCIILFFWEKKHDKTIQLLGVARLETPHPSPARVAVVRAPRKRVNSARPPLHRCGSRGGSRWWRF